MASEQQVQERCGVNVNYVQYPGSIDLFRTRLRRTSGCRNHGLWRLQIPTGTTGTDRG